MAIPKAMPLQGAKGGQTVSQNREHMASIGRKGGQAVSKNRDHMAEIGRKGGQSRSERGESETEAQEAESLSPAASKPPDSATTSQSAQ